MPFLKDIIISLDILFLAISLDEETELVIDLC